MTRRELLFALCIATRIKQPIINNTLLPFEIVKVKVKVRPNRMLQGNWKWEPQETIFLYGK